MPKGTIGVKIALEGENEYKKALKEIASEQKALKSEMALCSSEFKNSQNSIEALTSKYEVLSKQVEAQGQKVKVYSDALSEAQEYQQKAAENVEKYTAELDDEQKKLDELKASETASAEAIKEQEEAVKSASEALARANGEYDGASEKVRQYQTSLNYAQADLNKMESELQTTAGYLEEAKNSSDGCATSIDNLGKEVKETADEASTFGEVFKANLASEALVAGLNTVVGLIEKCGSELFEAGLNAAFYADSIITMSNNTGIATKTLQELTYAQELMDVSVETVTGSIARNIRSMASAQSGSEKYAEAYEKLGVAITDANGELRGGEEVFWEIIDALGSMDNAAERDATAMQLLGKSAQSLNSLIKIGSSGFRELANEANAAGFVMSESTLNQLLAVSDAWERMQNKITAVKNNIGAKVAPVLEKSFTAIGKAVENASDDIAELANKIIPALASGVTWIIENADIVLSVVGGLTAGFVAQHTIIPMVNTVMSLYTLATEGATIAQEGLNLAMMANPVTALITGIVALCAAIGTYCALNGDAEKATSELGKKNEELIASIHETEKAYGETVGEIEATAEVADGLAEKLEKLNGAYKNDGSKDAAVNMAQQKSLIEQLNTIYPDLNLQIDEHTGKLNKDVDALKSYIATVKEKAKADAGQKYLADQYENLVQLQVTQIELEQQREEIQKKINEEVERENAIRGQTPDDEAGIQARNDALQESEAIQKAYNDELEETANQLTANAEEQESLTGKIESFSEKMGEASTAIETVGDAAENTAGKTQGAVESFSDLSEAAQEYGNKIKESLENEVSLWDAVEVAKSNSMSKMLSDLDSNNEKLKEFNDGIEKLSKAGLNETALKELMEKGPSALGTINELLSENGKHIDEFNKKVEERNKLLEESSLVAGKAVEATVAPIDEAGEKEAGEKAAKVRLQSEAEVIENDTSVPGAMAQATKKSLDTNANIYSEVGKAKAKFITEAEIEGISDNTQLVSDAQGEQAKNASADAEKTITEAGEASGKAYAQGVANGIANNTNLITTAVDKAINDAASKTKTNALTAPQAVNNLNSTAQSTSAYDLEQPFTMMNALENTTNNTNVTVVLEGDADGVFNLVQQQATVNKLRTGYSGL